MQLVANISLGKCINVVLTPICDRHTDFVAGQENFKTWFWTFTCNGTLDLCEGKKVRVQFRVGRHLNINQSWGKMSGIAGSVKKFTMNGPVECSWHGSLIKFKRGRAQSSQQRAVKGDTNRAKLFPRDQARFREQSYDGNDSHIVIDSTKLGLRHLQSKQIQLLAFYQLF